MTCRRVGGAILCGRAPRGRQPRSPPAPCCWPGCDRNATQAGWGCTPHWYRLSPSLRDRLWRAHRAELAANGRLGQAWHIVAEEARSWAEDRLAAPSTDRRQGELPL